jgi:hypothetical protein
MNSENQQATTGDEDPLLSKEQLDVLIDMLMKNNKFVNAIITRVMDSGLVGKAILQTPNAAQVLTQNANFISAVGTAADVYINLNGAKLVKAAYEESVSAEAKKSPFAQTQQSPFARGPASILAVRRSNCHAIQEEGQGLVSIPKR